ncbi:MAG: Asp-tRNA(Asn)/Glu-tRNA(Gln) amidotransferase subunit GatB [Oscillospiraceae bacterium]|nr:Asp-tRNA(Asn)/Glu-tRNA(Gln) amidotransferase subunit GatB [Oscillospiraceae bacterium]
MKWEVVMGLEVHAELSTNTKIFCGCSAKFGGEPNTYVCDVCTGMPGTLPVLNQAVVESAVKLGLALECDITSPNRFDRKNYFYPDLPKAYQVSQLYSPICQNGKMELDGGTVRIRQIHMEEDAGKLLHTDGYTQMDYNRAGVPLLEIVSQPDFRTTEEVIAYLEQLREILVYLGICDGKMQEGSMRADVNLSVRPIGEEKFGTRTETKNLNSFKAISRAIAHETARQIEILEKGGEITQETRRWDDDKGESYSMRSKENSHDYRYFPEPDLPPVYIDEEWLARLRSEQPEFAHQKRQRYQSEHCLSPKDAAILTQHKPIAELFDRLVALSDNPRESFNLITIELMRLMNTLGVAPQELQVAPEKLAVLISLVTGGKINRNAYKQAVAAVYTTGCDPQEYIKANNLMMQETDSTAILDVAKSVIAENPTAVEEYRSGKQKAFGFLMGQMMKKLGNNANPELAKKTLSEYLDEI